MTYVPMTDASGWQMRYAGSGALKFPFQLPDLAKAQALGVGGHKHRIGNGRSLDQSFLPVYRNCADIGLPLGCYWYLQPKDSTPRQVHDRLAAWLDPYPLVRFIALDCENFYGQPAAPTNSDRAWLADWLDELCNLLRDVRGKPVIYAGNDWWDVQVGAAQGRFLGYDVIGPRYPRQGDPKQSDSWPKPPSDARLWESWVPWTKQPQLPNGLSNWSIWQFSSWGNALDFGWPADAGVVKLDLNLVRAEAFARLFGTPGAPDVVVDPPVVVVPPDAPPTFKEFDMSDLVMLDKPARFYDSRDPLGPNRLKAGEPRPIYTGHPEATVAFLHAEAVEASGSGSLVFWNGNGGRPNATSVGIFGGYGQSAVVAPVGGNAAWEPGYVWVQSSVDTHLVLDLQAFLVNNG